MQKKLLLFTCLCIGAMTVHVQAASTTNEQYYIPKTESAPVIDGVITGTEWDDALHRSLNAESTAPLYGTPEDCPTAEVYWMWNEKGFYFFADVTDTTAPATVHEAGTGSYNAGDGVQLCIYPDTTKTGSTAGELYFYSMAVASDGNAVIGEHFVYGTGSAGADVDNAVIACTQNGTSYTLEVFIPAECWTASRTPLTFQKGTTFAMTNILMEQNNSSQYLLCDSAYFDGVNANKYTLIDNGEEAETDVVFGAELPVDWGDPVLTAGAEADDMTGYSGSISGLEDTAGFANLEDSWVRYDFSVETDGKYAVVIQYTAPVGETCAVNVAMDDNSNGTYVKLAESDTDYYAAIPWELTAGKHSLYIMTPTGYDGETVKSGTVYGWNLYLMEVYEEQEQSPMVFYGDVNGDHLLNWHDAKLLSGYFAGNTAAIQENCTDLDNSGTFTRRDVMIFKRYLAGWEGYSIPYTKS